MSTIHIIGAGLSGLSAAVALADGTRKVCLYESTGQAGGRCRSYADPILNCTLDNGNHLLLAANEHSKKFIKTIGACEHFHTPQASYPMHDIKYEEDWELKPPFWLPKTALIEYIKLTRMMALPGNNQTVSDYFRSSSPLMKRFIDPICTSMLNTKPDEASARVFATCLKRILKHEDRASPYLPKGSWQDALINPAIDYLKSQNVELYFQQSLKAITHEDNHVTECQFSRNSVSIGTEDLVVLAIPAPNVSKLLPTITVPNEHSPILNIHYQMDHGLKPGTIYGFTGGMIDWVFVKDGLLSTTTSAADEHIESDTERLAEAAWPTIAKQFALPEEVPDFRVITEKRATFKATPACEAMRPPPVTEWDNLLLAGDYTNTQLPGCIEGAILSGERAAHYAASYRK